ncbi:MAG TPA: NADH-quinone oxidoreductase subunit NuoG [Rhodocyclaceae bacterium]|nr:NADH-quinone oxidoreductase subunit NuoG [Rhodocyclaceae bacterium]
MLELEIDGKAVQVKEGSTIIEAAHQVGAYIPHFCYHKKLSIAANCRMCLVAVEKAPKPLPACATPVTNGMKVFTHSDLAIKAQKGVMEFLLINHPLDCPICDQGGECQLQDLAVGYGQPASRYQEEKRVVPDKDLGALVSTDMTRCINCTRCVRFTQEIAGLMELGQAYRGERAEVMPFVEKTVDSELSGNIIDLCPVGALTSKPFRFSARTWELSRRRSVSPHDGLGANLIVQIKHDKVMRVLPLENEDVNECWLSDKDRYSYEALNGDERLTKPMVKQGGEWKEVEWNVALDYVAHGLRDVAKNEGAASVGTLVSPHATLEEMFLAAKLTRGLGSENVDFRLRRGDFTLDGLRRGAPWLGMKVAEFARLDRVLVVGSFLRKDHPLLAQRLRQSVKRGTQVSVVHSANDDLLMKLAGRLVGSPARLPSLLAEVVKAACEAKGLRCDLTATPSDEARRIAASLASGADVGIFLGNFAERHPQAGQLETLARQLAEIVGGRFGHLGEAANSVGGFTAKAFPGKAGLNAAAMIAQPRQAYVLVGLDPELDTADGAATLAALKSAKTVVLMSAFRNRAMLDVADAMLPISPFSETSGTYVNTEGRAQSFHAVARPRGDARPAWKVLRVLGNLLELPGFGYETSEQVRAEALGGEPGFVSGLDNDFSPPPVQLGQSVAGSLERVADIPIHFADPLARRATSLQKTRDAAVPTARMNASTLAGCGAADGAEVRVKTATGEVRLTAELDAGVPDGCVRVAGAHPATVGLGALSGAIAVERA